MTAEEKRKNLEALLQQAKTHEEEMRISYGLAKDRVRYFLQQLKQPSLDSQ